MKGIIRKPTVREKKIIEKQLGRPADNLAGIARYCPFGYPAVLLTYPFSQEKGVFPTTYWLSCPWLVKKVDRLEDKGLISFLTNRLKEDKTFYQEVEAAHREYARERFSMLTARDKEKIKDMSSGILKVLKESGVGGIREKEGVKCLHTHLAHYLATGRNPIGRFVWRKSGWPEKCYFAT